MSEPLKSVKVPLSSWKALTRLSAEMELPRTKVLERIITTTEDRLSHDIDTKLLDWLTTYTRLGIDGEAHRALVAIVKGYGE